MSFIWPPMLLLLAAHPARACWPTGRSERRRRLAVEAASGLGLGRAGPGPRLVGLPSPGSRRVLFVVGLTILVVALARPQSVVSLPREQGTVILAFDVSRSMAADDLKPTRMDAAKAAAKAFVAAPAAGRRHRRRRVQRGRHLGPGPDRATRRPCSPRSTGSDPQQGTSLGQGILASLSAIALAEGGRRRRATTRTARRRRRPSRRPVPAGRHAPAVIVLLSDGENTESPDPARARPRRRPIGASGSTRSASAARPAATLDLERLQGPHPARRGDPPADLRHHRRHVLRRGRRGRARGGLRRARTRA